MPRLVLLLTLLPGVALADVNDPGRVIDGDMIEIAGERISLHGPARYRRAAEPPGLRAAWRDLAMRRRGERHALQVP